MGLDVSHDCWHGPYSSFMRFRMELSKAAGLPPLLLMEGFYSQEDYEHPLAKLNSKGFNNHEQPTRFEQTINSLPIKWECLKDDPIIILLDHSDCEGEIDWKECERLAFRLKEILPNMPDEKFGISGSWQDRTQQFIEGLQEAYAKKENVKFR